MEILVKNENFSQKQKFWSKIEILAKNGNCRKKIQVLVKNGNLGQKYKFEQFLNY